MPEGEAWPTPFESDLLRAYGELSADLVVNWHRWVSRRVGTYTVLQPGHIHVGCTVDFRVPREYPMLATLREALQESRAFGADQIFLPMTLLSSGIGPWAFSAHDENGKRLPLLDALGNRNIAQAALAGLAAGVCDNLDLARRIAFGIVNGAQRAALDEAKRRWLGLLRLAHSSPPPDRSHDAELYRAFVEFAKPSRQLSWTQLGTGGRSAWSACLSSRPFLEALGRYSQAAPMHVAVDLDAGRRQIVKLQWKGRVLKELTEAGAHPGTEQLLSPEARDLDNQLVLPIPMLGGCEVQHLQVVLGDDILLSPLIDVLRTADKDPGHPTSIGFALNQPDTGVAHLTRRWNDVAADPDAVFDQGAIVATYTTARSALLVSYAITAAFLSATAIGTTAAMYSLHQSPSDRADVDAVTTVLTFGAGLFGILVPQVGTAPTARALLARTRHRLAAGSATVVLMALLVALWALVGDERPSWVLLGGLSILTVVTVYSCLAPMALLRRGVRQWRASLQQAPP